MDTEMIQRWNAVVGDDDWVYHLGDFTLSDRAIAYRYFAQLNGRIKILAYPWHHDKRWLPNHYGPVDIVSATNWRVELLPPMVALELSEYGDGQHPKVLVLCHYPLAVWDRKHYGSWHIFGHCHGRREGEGLSFDVGVDANDFYPLALSAVARRMKEKAKWLELRTGK